MMQNLTKDNANTSNAILRTSMRSASKEGARVSVRSRSREGQHTARSKSREGQVTARSNKEVVYEV